MVSPFGNQAKPVTASEISILVLFGPNMLLYTH
uniref:Uncharacterized protein n=1 Tax=Arundo donax TaxID=35708 RepID=A0A0A9FNQ4_ARUDO